MNIFDMVGEFQRVFDADQPLAVRLKLIDEEFSELRRELLAETLDQRKILKELSDSLYVLAGLAVDLQLEEEAQEVFRRVHESNMSKLTADGEVLRREDGKILKSDQYREAQLEDIL